MVTATAETLAMTTESETAAAVRVAGVVGRAAAAVARAAAAALVAVRAVKAARVAVAVAKATGVGEVVKAEMMEMEEEKEPFHSGMGSVAAILRRTST